ncbi:MAG: HlyD family efflux transporter periplasmic adaptor subunit [Lachnospiraceae bacterium]|nr:HlyD family efflux transporter periplasmic adaptor subunit [Lachnospiraceae bacterium]
MGTPDNSGTIKIRKDLIKNIAIVFLAVMLLLTFFSNSIINKALPEVAVKYVENGSISEKVRGTGTVETEDPYTVMIKESRVIASVAVKEGDEVEKDQVLFYLEDSDSDELEKAERELEDLIYKYTTGALSGEMSASAYNAATNGQVAGMDTYEARIEAARARVKAAQEAVDSVVREQTIASGNVSVISEEELNNTKIELEKAKTELDNARSAYEDVKKVVDGGNGGVDSAKSTMESAEIDMANAKSKYESEANTLKGAIISNDSVTAAFNAKNTNYNVSNGTEIADMVFESDDTVNSGVLNDWLSVQTSGYDKYDDFTAAYKKYHEANTTYRDAKSAYDAEVAKSSGYTQAAGRLPGLESAYKSAANKVSELETKVTRLSNELDENRENAKANSDRLNADLAVKKADADKELAKAKEDQTQLLLDISKTLDLSNQNSIIREQKEKIEKLKEMSTGATITSPVSGKILTIGKKAGETADATTELATIQVEGKPMSMSFSVTNEQAAKVSVGAKAELQNAWYYDNVEVMLTKIVPDKTEPGKKKNLTFSVEGNVSNGESLSVAVGQRSKEYDRIVPNSAVREDNRGKFVLVVEEKGTPFGTRYKAKRVDVNVLASDDTNTAIEAEIDYAYVITTSNKPVGAGDQVRLADS